MKRTQPDLQRAMVIDRLLWEMFLFEVVQSPSSSVQKIYGNGTWRHSLMMNMVVTLDWELDPMILKDLSKLNDSMILWKFCKLH